MKVLISATMLAVLCCTATPVLADGPDELWEVTMKMEMAGMPAMPSRTQNVCNRKGNPDAFCSCSHGAGRMMSRDEAARTFTLGDHAAATAGVECRKDASVLDETPAAYKDIDAVMAAQADLVEVLHTLKQVVCVKG